MTIDLNCDLGESTDPARAELEARVVRAVSSVNIACGIHAGSPEVMRRIVVLAKESKIAIGAHPGFRDQEGMGRRLVTTSSTEVENLISYQVGALAAIAALENTALCHVKPHGALYNTAARDVTMASAIARAVRAVDPRLTLIGLAGSPFIDVVKNIGLAVGREAFADRAYQPDGSLVPRDRPGAIIDDEREVISRVLSLVRDRFLLTIDGTPLSIDADTICVHGDTQDADRLASAIRRALEEVGIGIAPIPSSHA